MKDFAGKIVLVTGASSGIGRAAAVKLGYEGANVIVAARREVNGMQTVEAVIEAGGTASFIAFDIGDEASIDALFAAIEARHGRLDAALNNAGTEGDPAMLPDMAIAEFDRVFNVNARGTWLCMRHELRMMRAQGGGAIVNTASIAGVVGFPMSSAYTASKHAIVGMTKSASLDMAPMGIRVNCLCPGGTTTEMSERWTTRVPGGEAELAQRVPMRRFARAEEQAEVAVFMLSDAASYMSGSVMVVDGGATVN